MLKTMTRERATVLTSSLAAMAILGAMVTAQPARTPPSARLARLEADLRYQIELGSRLDRGAFEAKTKQLDEALETWRKSPQSKGDYELITGWLREAVLKSLPGESGEWPATPEFGPAQHVARKAVAAEENFQKPQAEVRKPQESADKQKPAVNNQADSVKTLDVEPAAKPQVRVAPSRPSASAPPANEPGKRATGEAEPFIVNISDPVPIGAAHLAGEAPQGKGRVGAHVVEKVETPLTSPPTVIDRPELAAEEAVVGGGERRAPTPAQTADVYDEELVTPAVAKPQAAEGAVQVNLSELSARIRGYHDELREIEATVVASREEMTVGEVAKLVGRLESLAGQNQFLRLYYDALTEEERQFVRAPKPMLVTIKLVQQQRALSEALSVDDHFSAADVAGDSELAKRLDAVAEFVGDERPSVPCCGARSKK